MLCVFMETIYRFCIAQNFKSLNRNKRVDSVANNFFLIIYLIVYLKINLRLFNVEKVICPRAAFLCDLIKEEPTEANEEEGRRQPGKAHPRTDLRESRPRPVSAHFNIV